VKSTSGPASQSVLLRYGFWALWFLVVPATVAISLVAWLQSTQGPLAQIGAQVRDQSVPVTILLFTFAEMAIYSLRHSLPYAEMLGEVGRPDLPRDSLRAYEGAAQLNAEAERILERHGKAIAREVSKINYERVTNSLANLRQSMDAQPFEPRRFQEHFDMAHRLVDEHLAPWRKSETRELVESIGVAVLVALSLRAVVVEAFKIPSGSMLPTLQIDDHIFVNKFTYGPKLPFIGTRIATDMPPERGDVIVFEFPDPAPGQEGQDFIKRVIAMPGDTLEVRHGQPIINGWKVPRCRVGQYPFRQNDGNASDVGELFVEFLGDAAYLTVYDGGAAMAYEGPFRVPSGEIYVMGDNRNNSHDSRKWHGGKGGGVPFANIQGRAMRVWWPLSRMLVPVMGHPELPKGMSPALTEGIDRCLAQRPNETTPPTATRTAGP
jgi:signal peptidase I